MLHLYNVIFGWNRFKQSNMLSIILNLCPTFQQNIRGNAGKFLTLTFSHFVRLEQGVKGKKNVSLNDSNNRSSNEIAEIVAKFIQSTKVDSMMHTQSTLYEGIIVTGMLLSIAKGPTERQTSWLLFFFLQRLKK